MEASTEVPASSSTKTTTEERASQLTAKSTCDDETVTSCSSPVVGKDIKASASSSATKKSSDSSSSQEPPICVYVTMKGGIIGPERQVYEYFAGGYTEVELIGCGMAVPHVVLIAHQLVDRKMGINAKTTTTISGAGGSAPNGTTSSSTPSQPRSRHSSSVHNNQPAHPPPPYTPGIRVVLTRHPTFSGCKLEAENAVFLSPSEGTSFTPLYDDEPSDYMVSLNAGDEGLYVGGKALNAAFASSLSSANLDVLTFEALHQKLLDKAWSENSDAATWKDVYAVEGVNLAGTCPGVIVALCRPNVELKSKHSSKAVGASFLSLFAPDHTPGGNRRNMGMLYVVGPKGNDFKEAKDFLDAVRLTATNASQLLIDYNTLVKRTRSERRELERINTIRVALFSGGAFIHKDVTKQEVAVAIVEGWIDAYRWRVAPRVEFAFDEDCFKQAWEKIAEVKHSEALRRGNPYLWRPTYNANNGYNNNSNSVTPHN